jgi:hypothetical protein
MQAALVELIEQHRCHAFERGILLQHAGEDAFGDDLEARCRTYARIQAHAVAHRLANPFAQRLRHARGHGAGGQASGLQQQDDHRTHGSSSRTSGTVLCPRRAALPARRCDRRAARRAAVQYGFNGSGLNSVIGRA